MENPPLSKKLHTGNRESPSPLLELPESALECILERLPPEALFRAAGVCVLLRRICRDGDNQLWETHMKRKWRSLLSPAAYRAWENFTLPTNTITKPLMYFYFAFHTGKFWFPAQVYYSENWDVTFVLSCYDAELSYNSESDNFQARYPSHGRKADLEVETGIERERVRAPPVDISPTQVYVSKCLNEQQPGDHVEVQWKRYKTSPYGWWYGVVGHLETCNGSVEYCKCSNCDSMVVEFKQYAIGSRWRKVTLSRKSIGEGVGNRGQGYYGGIRKLYTSQEIAVWYAMWPPHTLDT